jgi:hypothetical protein
MNASQVFDRDEIEITPEMIEAGMEALSLWDFYDLDEWKVADIYRAMESVHRAVTVAKTSEAAPDPTVGQN